MSAPDPKAVEGAIAKLARDGGCDCADCRARVTLIAAANAYLRTPTAPQGAEPVAYRTQLASGTWLVCAAGEKLEQDWRAIEGVDLQPLYAAPQGAEIAREASRSAHPDVVRLLREFHLDAMGRGHDPNHALTKLMVSGYMQKRGPEVIAALAAHDRMMAEVSAAIDAALTPTAPQGAEIVREPDDNMLAEGADFLSAIRRGAVTGTDKDLARGMFMRMLDAALTPTDAETKG